MRFHCIIYFRFSERSDERTHCERRDWKERSHTRRTLEWFGEGMLIKVIRPASHASALSKKVRQTGNHMDVRTKIFKMTYIFAVSSSELFFLKVTLRWTDGWTHSRVTWIIVKCLPPGRTVAISIIDNTLRFGEDQIRLAYDHHPTPFPSLTLYLGYKAGYTAT